MLNERLQYIAGNFGTDFFQHLRERNIQKRILPQHSFDITKNQLNRLIIGRVRAQKNVQLVGFFKKLFHLLSVVDSGVIDQKNVMWRAWELM